MEVNRILSNEFRSHRLNDGAEWYQAVRNKSRSNGFGLRASLVAQAG